MNVNHMLVVVGVVGMIGLLGPASTAEALSDLKPDAAESCRALTVPDLPGRTPVTIGCVDTQAQRFKLDAGALPYLPGASASVAGDVPGLDNPPGWFVYQHPGVFTATTALRAQREVPPSGIGTPYHVSKAIWGLTYTGVNEQQFEWAVTGELHNRTSSPAQHVALQGTIFKEANGVGPIGPSFGGNFNCSDMTGQPEPGYSCVGAEIDTSTTASGLDPNRQRVGVHIVMAGVEPSTGAHFGYGILMGGRARDVVDRGIHMVETYGVGLNTSAATFAVAPIFMGQGQKIVFDGTDASLSFGRSLSYANGALAYQTPAGTALRVSDSGDLRVTSLQVKPGAPKSSTSPCSAGTITFDAAFIYTCVAPNTWRRAASAAW